MKAILDRFLFKLIFCFLNQFFLNTKLTKNKTKTKKTSFDLKKKIKIKSKQLFNFFIMMKPANYLKTLKKKAILKKLQNPTQCNFFSNPH